VNETAAPDLLAAIVASTRTRVRAEAAGCPARELERRIPAMRPTRGFRDALAAPGLRVIAECKRRSPSRGVLRQAYDPVAIATGYAEAGAAAISVLTEPTFFDGRLQHLASVRDAVDLPLLRKDFVVDDYQIVEARVGGADAVLLIVAALTDAELRRLISEAAGLGLDALVEVHDERELDRAVAAGATMIGVNNRNLKTLAVDVGGAERLAAGMPADVLAVAESGLRTTDDLDRLRALGYAAFLVGERLMTADDPAAALTALLGGGQRS
jgi:indole-3-glycerol phosphate synthase